MHYTPEQQTTLYNCMNSAVIPLSPTQGSNRADQQAIRLHSVK
jgi:hypothetical protein